MHIHDCYIHTYITAIIFLKLQDANNSDAACASLITESTCSAACRQVHRLSTVCNFVLMMNKSRGC